MRIAFFVFMLVFLASPASQVDARWKAEYASHTPQVRDWYESQTTTRKRASASRPAGTSPAACIPIR